MEPQAPRLSPPAIPDRRRRLGAQGEQLAVEHLQRRGLTILDRNFRTRWGELDIIARDPGFLVFCEVKTRLATGSWRGPLESVTPHKQRQLRRMAGQWLAQRPGGVRSPQCRFDAVGITLDRDGRLIRLDHLEAAF